MIFDKEQLTSFVDNGGRAIRNISVAYYWKGGTRGAEKQWDEPHNWYNRSIPGWFDTVVILECNTVGHHFPIVGTFANDISQLVIGPGAKLYIGKNGKLSIDGMCKKALGVINRGDLIINGEMTIHRTLNANIRNNGRILNKGSLAIDKNEQKGFVHSENAWLENYGDLLFF